MNSPDTSSTRYAGELIGRIGNVLVGWAVDHGDLDRPVSVELCVDGHKWTTLLAESFDSSLRNQGLGDGCHAFSVEMPKWMRLHGGVVSAYIANVDQHIGSIDLKALRRSGQFDALNDGEDPQGPRFVLAEIQYLGFLKCVGWAFDSNAPGTHQEIRITERDSSGEEKELLRIMADRYRRDLKEAKMGNGDHGFEVFLPRTLADNQPHQLHFYAPDGRELFGSPVTITVSPSGATGLVDQITDRLANRGVLDAESASELKLLSRMAFDVDALAPPDYRTSAYATWLDTLGQPPVSAWPSTHEVVVWSEAPVSVEVRSRLEDSGVRQFWVGALTASDCTLIDDDTVLLGIRSDVEPIGDRLAHLLQQAIEAPSALVTCDHDMAQCAEDGSTAGRDPFFKPAGDLDLHLATDCYAVAFALTQRLLVDWVGHHGSVDWWDAPVLALINDAHIHVPWVVVRVNTPWIQDQATTRLQRWLQDHQIPCQVTGGGGQMRWRDVSWASSANTSAVTVIIPTRDAAVMTQKALASAMAKTDRVDVEWMIVNNQSTESDTLQWFEQLRAAGHTVLDYDAAFNYADMMNVAIESARGEVVVLLNNDTEMLSEGWLDELTGLLARPEVGVVGGLLFYPDGDVQHAGVFFDVDGRPDHRVGDLDPRWPWMARVAHQVDCVTGALLAIRKADYQAVGGLDGRHFKVAFNDVELCLKVQRHGLRVLYTPAVRAIHQESKTRSVDATPAKAKRFQSEMRAIRDRFGASRRTTP